MKLPSRRAALIAAVIGILSLFAAVNAALFALNFPDERDYWRLAENLVRSGTLSSDGINPSATRPPLVAWVLTPFVAAGLPLEAARPWFVLFFAGSGALTGYMLCRLFPASTAVPVIGTAFVLCHPLYLFSAGNLYPQQILTPLLLAALALALRQPRSMRAILARSILIGAVTAASVLASAPAIFALLPVFALLVWEDGGAIRRAPSLHATRAVVAAIALLLCLSPYLIRNWRNVHPGLYVSLNAGTNLLFGNSPRTTPTSGVRVNVSEYLEGHETESEFDSNTRLTEVAIKNVRADPGRYSRLYLKKVFAGLGNTVKTVRHGYNRPATLAMWGYMTLVWIGVGRIFFCLMRRDSPLPAAGAFDCHLVTVFALLVLAGYFLNLFGYSVFFMRLRFRIPVDVAVAIIAVAGWGVTRTSLRPRQN